MAKGNGKARPFEQQLLEQMTRGFDRLDGRLERITERLDQLVENTGAHWRDHEKRLRAVESKLRLK